MASAGPEPMTLDLNQPLGTIDRRARIVRLPKVSGGQAAFALLALAVIGASAASALREPDFRLQAKSTETAAPAMTLEAAVPSPAEGAPTVTRGNETPGMRVVEVAPFALDEAYTGSIRVSEPGSLRQPPRFAHIPDDALIEPSEFGPLPRRGSDGRRPLDVYAGEGSRSGGVRIALIVGGIGISQTGTQGALASLPQAVTLGFAATGNSLDRWMHEARRAGHELLLQVPMEPFGYPNVSAGPGTLTAESAAAGDLSDLHRALGRMTNYVGVMNFMGARLASEPAALVPVLAEIERRGLLFVEDGASPRSVARDVAMANRVPFARGERVLDEVRDAAAIRAELDILERSARAQGSAIGLASAFDVSVAAIAQWIPEAQARGIEIVPVSALAHDPQMF